MARLDKSGFKPRIIYNFEEMRKACCLFYDKELERQISRFEAWQRSEDWRHTIACSGPVLTQEQADKGYARLLRDIMTNKKRRT